MGRQYLKYGAGFAGAMVGIAVITAIIMMVVASCAKAQPLRGCWCRFVHPPTVYAQHYEALARIFKVLNAAGISAWISDGSLLGYARHNKQMVPWDDDIDIELWDKDVPAMVAALKPHAKVVNHKLLGVTKVNFADLPAACIDLYHLEARPDGMSQNVSWLVRMQQPNTTLPTASRWPIQPAVFGPVSVNIPVNYLLYLDHHYPGWQDTVIIEGAHTLNGVGKLFYNPKYKTTWPLPPCTCNA